MIIAVKFVYKHYLASYTVNFFPYIPLMIVQYKHVQIHVSRNAQWIGEVTLQGVENRIYEQ